ALRAGAAALSPALAQAHPRLGRSRLHDAREGGPGRGGRPRAPRRDGEGAQEARRRVPSQAPAAPTSPPPPALSPARDTPDPAGSVKRISTRCATAARTLRCERLCTNSRPMKNAPTVGG